MQPSPQSSRLGGLLDDDDDDAQLADLAALAEAPEPERELGEAADGGYADLEDPDERDDETDKADVLEWQPETQREYLGLCLGDAEAAAKLLPLLDPANFADVRHGQIARILREHHDDHGHPPTPAIVAEALRAKNATAKPDKLLALVQELNAVLAYAKSPPRHALGHYAERAAAFRAAARYKHAVFAAMHAVNKGEATPAQAQAMVAAADLGEDAGDEHEGCYALDRLAELSPPTWLVHRHLPRGDVGGLAVLYGPPGSGKSFVAIDLALSVASGTPYAKHFAVEQGPVLYLAGEGASGLRKRVQAWRQDRPDADLDPRGLVVCPRIWPLATDPAAAKQVADLAKRQLGRDPALVVIDTLACYHGGSENDPKEQQAFANSCKRIAAETRAVVLVVAHTGKDAERGIRGHNSLEGAADAILEASGRPAEGTRIRQTKAKDSEPLPAYRLRQKLWEIPDDPDGSLTLAYDRDEAQARAEERRADRDGDEAALLAAIGSRGNATINDLIEATGDKRTTVQRRLNALRNAGHIRQQRGAKNRAATFALADPVADMVAGDGGDDRRA